MRLDNLLQQLAEEGLISAEDVPAIIAKTGAEQNNATHAWYVHFLLGFSAWLAAGLFIAAIILFGLFDSPIVVLTLGLIMIGLAFGLRISVIDFGEELAPLVGISDIFLAQLALAGSITGQLLVLYGVADIFYEVGGGVVLFLMSCGLFWVFPDRLHRFISVLLAVFALYWLCNTAEFVAGFHLIAVLLLAASVWLWWQADRRWNNVRSARALPASYATPIALFVLLGSNQSLSESFGSDNLYWLTAAAGIAAALFVSWQILAAYGLLDFTNPLRPVATFGLILIVGLLTATHPGLLIAFTLLALAYWRSGIVLGVLSSAAALFFVSTYYYRLDITLLNKSFVLLATGVVILIAWALQRRALRQPDAIGEVA